MVMYVHNVCPWSETYHALLFGGAMRHTVVRVSLTLGACMRIKVLALQFSCLFHEERQSIVQLTSTID